MSLIKKNVTLKVTLYAAIGGGIARMPNSNRHSGIKLLSSEGAVQFPISRGGQGIIQEETPDGKNVVIYMTIKDRLSGLYSYSQFNILVSKESLNFFFQVQ